jgi:predicted enzyme related to lactoylglutathione lyase
MSWHGTFCWNELVTHDVERAKNFYAATMGWTFEAMHGPDGSTYWRAMKDGKGIAGLFPLTGENCKDVAEGWMPYIAVDDVDASVQLALDSGATLMRPIFDVPDVGRIAVLREPGGAGICWITPKPPAHPQ